MIDRLVKVNSIARLIESGNQNDAEIVQAACTVGMARRTERKGFLMMMDGLVKVPLITCLIESGDQGDGKVFQADRVIWGWTCLPMKIKGFINVTPITPLMEPIVEAVDPLINIAHLVG